MYKKTKFYNNVYWVERNSFIPFDQVNVDYQDYLKWIAEGNEPLPADEPEPPVAPQEPAPEPEVEPVSEATPAPEPEVVPAPEQETPASENVVDL
jgi:hypothetical protein